MPEEQVEQPKRRQISTTLTAADFERVKNARFAARHNTMGEIMRTALLEYCEKVEAQANA